MPLYTITNRDSNSTGHGRVYVGSCSIEIRRRMARHYYLGEHATDKSPELYRDMHATLKRARATSEWKDSTTTDILKRYYVTVAEASAVGSRSELVKNEQVLLDKLQGLSVSPCYNVRRPVSSKVTDDKRAARKVAYHATKVMCSCGRMISAGNRSHAKSAVHMRA